MPGSREYVKAWKKANKERMHQAYLRYRAKYPERFPPAPPLLTPEQRKLNNAANARKWRAENPERVREINRKSLQKRMDRKRETNREWVKRNIDKVRANKRAWIAAHPGSNNERSRKWARNNPEKMFDGRAKSHQNRVKRLTEIGTFTFKEWGKLLDDTGHKCLCCGIPESQAIYKHCKNDIVKRGKLTADHVIPISRGGAGTIDNIAPLCLSCNIRKGTKTTDYRINLDVAC